MFPFFNTPMSIIYSVKIVSSIHHSQHHSYSSFFIFLFLTLFCNPLSFLFFFFVLAQPQRMMQIITKAHVFFCLYTTFLYQDLHFCLSIKERERDRERERERVKKNLRERERRRGGGISVSHASLPHVTFTSQTHPFPLITF